MRIDWQNSRARARPVTARKDSGSRRTLSRRCRRRARCLTDRRLIDFVNCFDFLRSPNQFEQIAISCAFSFFQLLAHCRPNYLVHQCRFSTAGNSCDHRKPSDGEANIDIFQIIRSRITDFDPIFNVAQGPTRSAGRMPKRYFQAAGRFGICIFFTSSSVPVATTCPP